jgi:hypothetical protein
MRVAHGIFRENLSIFNEGAIQKSSIIAHEGEPQKTVRHFEARSPYQ